MPINTLNKIEMESYSYNEYNKDNKEILHKPYTNYSHYENMLNKDKEKNDSIDKRLHSIVNIYMKLKNHKPKNTEELSGESSKQSNLKFLQKHTPIDDVSNKRKNSNTYSNKNMNKCKK